MLSDVEEGSYRMLTRLAPVATLIDTKQQSATTCFSTQKGPRHGGQCPGAGLLVKRRNSWCWKVRW